MTDKPDTSQPPESKKIESTEDKQPKSSQKSNKIPEKLKFTEEDTIKIKYNF